MKEKVLYINLPKGTEYQKAEVTEDGRLAISYTGEPIMPKPLIGGTSVYQKNDGTPYWYCRIKEGRDEFMHVYFGDLTENDLFYDTNGNERKFVSEEEKIFKENVLKALKNKPSEGYRWIPVYEPSIDELSNNLQFRRVQPEAVFRGIAGVKSMFKKYSPENGSKVASITTYFLLLLRWLKDEIATLKQLVEDSDSITIIRYKESPVKPIKYSEGCFFGGIHFSSSIGRIVENPECRYGYSFTGAWSLKNFRNSFAKIYNPPTQYRSVLPELDVPLLELTK